MQKKIYIEQKNHSAMPETLSKDTDPVDGCTDAGQPIKSIGTG
jgi:hypothetical protein